MTQFLLIRHGEPDWKLKDTLGLEGALRDFVPLTEQGESQVHCLSQNPPLHGIELIVSSPYTRSLQTAAILSQHLQVPLKVELDLREWTPDRFQARTLSELNALLEDYNAHDGIPEEGKIPLWETRESVLCRCTNVLKKYVNYSRVAVVAHGMVIRILLNLGPDAEIQYASVHEYEFG